MAVLEQLEFIPFDPCRFVGKTVSAPAGSREAFGWLWEQCGLDGSLELLATLPALNGQADYNIGYMDWDDGPVADPVNYRAGRFLQAGTPVPAGFQHRDLPAMTVGTGWFRGEIRDVLGSMYEITRNAIIAEGQYMILYPQHYFVAEVYPPGQSYTPGSIVRLGCYLPCAAIL